MVFLSRHPTTDMTRAIFQPTDPPGPSGRLLRLRRNLPWMLEKYPGDIVEIGAGYGEATKIFLEMADRYDRRVLVIDPWDHHDGLRQWDKGDLNYAYTYEKFRENVGDHPRLDVCRELSDSTEAFCALDRLKGVAFMLLDGDMSTDGMLADLNTAAKMDAAIICVDDYGFRRSVRGAVCLLLNQSDYSLHHADEGSPHEAYLFRA